VKQTEWDRLLAKVGGGDFKAEFPLIDCTSIFMAVVDEIHTEPNKAQR